MSILRFNGYKVQEMAYKRNAHYQPANKQIELDPKITTKIDITDNDINITLTVMIGSLEKGSMPFQVSCSIIGNFTYNPDEDNTNIGIDTFVRHNAVAILYPYARAIIATLTTTSNEFPGYNMPTINVAKLLTQDNSN
ncbi:protein-export chaperone SecB [Lentilactobacillus sp. IMAU92037]|uniref:protein-export chaperone SecB n=1 Tax=Lentilactobacillus TaxID=2767893 RepID=UPI001C2757C1|nr:MULTISPECIES: protein-export chaperone SecB [Lentilactobacillus]MBU9790338.1 protein-export chaperone SecB [Lentilactobacillus dabitei]MBV0930009.1 protein-export chaperone SecB [Lentilactobacillus dabitei]MDM7515369.1 protein-export chaperone SecB [Lentilactobacillus sp. TOM.63]